MADGDLLPDLYIAEMPWKLNELQGVRMARSGKSQVLMMTEPFWSFELFTTWLDAEDYQTWEQFLIDRRGSASTFTAWRQDRPYGRVPVSSDVGLTITAYDRAASTVSFGATGAWTVTKGDPLSYYTAQGGYWHGMAMETKSAVSNAMAALKVHPAPFAPHAETPAPRRIRALAEFQIQLPLPMPIVRVDERRVNFSATQIIRG
jgi:hypothetical protein